MANGYKSTKRKRTLNIGTWNMKGLTMNYQEEITELKKYNIDILAMSEKKKNEAKYEEINDYIHIYSEVNKGEKAFNYM